MENAFYLTNIIIFFCLSMRYLKKEPNKMLALESQYES